MWRYIEKVYEEFFFAVLSVSNIFIFETRETSNVFCCDHSPPPEVQ